MDHILFKEAQHMTGSSIVAVVIVIFLFVSVYRLRRMGALVRAVLVLIVAIMAVTFVLLFTLKFETVYHPRYVEHRFASVFGAAYDTVSLDSVVRVKVLTYNPADYGGWGAKGDGKTQVYNASGNKGVLFTFKSGRRLLLGTQQADTLYARLKGYYPLE